MGLFGKKPISRATIRAELEARERSVEISDRDMRRMNKGWKQDERGGWQPPDTVWVSPRGEVYHRFPCCNTGIAPIAGAKMMSEKEAIRRGYRQCSRCDWERPYQYL